MRKNTVFMFSGQGSQYYRMGEELYLSSRTFKKWMNRFDEHLREKTGTALIALLYGETAKKEEAFDRILYTHPATFAVQYSLAQVLIEKGVEPDSVMGTSLGEYVSMAVAEVMPADGLTDLLIEQARLLEKHCPQGAMVAVLENGEWYYKTPELYEKSELASIHYHHHFTVACEKNNLHGITAFLKKKGIPHQVLPVAYGFHSSLIDPIKADCLDILNAKKYHTPKVPYISCVYGHDLGAVTSRYLWDVVRSPIRFPEAIRFMERDKSNIYIDLGPAGTLAAFSRYNLAPGSHSVSLSTITPFGNDQKGMEKVWALFSDHKIQSEEGEETSMAVYVFPGQGSQYKGMGGDLFDEFAALTAKADEVLGYSIKALCLEDPKQQLVQTQFTQPALYTVNALSYLKKINETGARPDFVAGHSLGEYNALLAAEVFDFETGLKLVKKRGELMSRASGGGMAAVFGLSGEKIQAVLDENDLKIDIANYNTPSQIVISGLKGEIQRAQPIFEAAGAQRYVVLNVGGAFHSRFMKAAGKEFAAFLDSFRFSEAKIPVISNVTARPYKGADLKRNLAEQITRPVKWTESIRFLMGKGEVAIEQIGPGTAMTGMVKSILSEATPLFVPEAEVFEAVAAAREEAEGIYGLAAGSLGDAEFKRDYNIKYAYLTGSMYKGIASKEMVIRMGKAGMMGFLGTGGLDLRQIEADIQHIRKALKEGQAYGINLLYNPLEPEMEEALADLYMKYGVRNIEASAYMTITPPLVRYRLKGLKRSGSGAVVAENRIIAKLSRPEVAELFLSPAPERIVSKLVQEGKLTREEADLAKAVPMADDICVEADSGGHTDQGVAYALMPAMLKLRDEWMKRHRYGKRIRVGAAGGIGTPEAAAAAFILGADFIMTGSINQCTVEAGTSDAVKDLLQAANVQDTAIAPAGDMFELGAKVQVLKKGLLFPSRANKLYELYKHYDSLEAIDEKTRTQLQEKYFQKRFEEIYEEAKTYYPPEEIERAERNAKQKMALIFRWYFGYSSRLALSGNDERKVDFQIFCGPSLGAFNQHVKGTRLESWRNRHVDEIAEKLMTETAEWLNDRLQSLL